MTSPKNNMSLHKLVKISITRNTSNKTFISLYNQLNEKAPVEENDYLTNLLELNPSSSKEGNKLKIEYTLSLAMSSEEQLNMFWKCLPKLKIDNQIQLLIQLNNILLAKSNIEKLTNERLKDVINTQFIKYTSNYLEGLSSLDLLRDKLAISLLNHIIIVWCSILKKYTLCLNTGLFKEIAAKIVATLTENKLQNTLNYFLSSTSSILNTSELHVDSNQISRQKKTDSSNTTSTSQIVKNISSINPNSKKAIRLNNVKKYLWLNSIMKKWKFNNDGFLNSFESNFLSKSQSNNLKRPYFLAYELVVTLFSGIGTSSNSKEAPYVLFNWKNFIIAKLPIILNSITFATSHSSTSEDVSLKQDSLEDAILNALSSLEESVIKTVMNFSIGNSPNYDLRQKFIKSCIYNDLIPITSFHKIFPGEANVTHQMLNNELSQFNKLNSVGDELEKKLLQVNSEFTSLEDSGLIKYIDSLPSLFELSSTKQTELSETVNGIIDHLITERNNEKLYRLLLPILNNLQVLNLICFHSRDGPLLILHKLINYVDNQDFNVDDDDNFQETYAYFGVIILGITLILETFKIDHSKISITDSYTIDYINKFYYRLCDNLTNLSSSNSEEDSTIISNYNSLLSDWINALFDDTNDGLSDDLIKSVNVKQIYKMIPIIYQQSIIATSSNKIDSKILNNGIDYLSQMFLIPCTLSIIEWLLRRIWVEDTRLDAIEIQVLHELIKSNFEDSEESNSESNLIFQIVLKISGNKIVSTLKRLPNFKSSEIVTSIIDRVLSKVDPTYLEGIPSFQLNERVNLCEQLKSKVMSLINTNDNSYQFISHFLLINNEEEFMKYIIEEISSYQKSNANSEDIKIFLNVSIFISLLNLVESNKDSQYWIDELSKPAPQPINSNSDETQFTLPMDYHYSSIFNNVDDLSNDDELFSGQSSRNSIAAIENLNLRTKKFNNFFHKLNTVKYLCDVDDRSTFAKSLKIFKYKLINELGTFDI